MIFIDFLNPGVTMLPDMLMNLEKGIESATGLKESCRAGKYFPRNVQEKINGKNNLNQNFLISQVYKLQVIYNIPGINVALVFISIIDCQSTSLSQMCCLTSLGPFKPRRLAGFLYKVLLMKSFMIKYPVHT